MMPKEVKYHSPEKMKSTFKEMNNMRKQQLFCDLNIKCGDKVLSVHKVVLASSSEYYNKMFTGSFKDSQVEVITTNEIIAPNAFEVLINYMYTSYLEITEHNVLELLVASNFLLLFDIYDVCKKFIKDNLNVENCLNVYSIAYWYNMSELNKVSFFFILDHFIEMVNSSNFLLLSFDQIKELVLNDHLNAKEEKIYEAIILWVKHNMEDRSKFMPELLQAIRLPLISMKYIVENIEKENLVTSNSKCKDLLCSAIGTHLNDGQSKCIYKHRTRAQVFVILNFYNLATTKIQYYDIINKELHPAITIAKHTEHIHLTSILLNDGRIFQLKTEEKLNYKRTEYIIANCYALIYNGNLKSWNRTSSCDFHHSNGSIIQFYDHVYVFSRKGSGYYSIQNNSWNNINKHVPSSDGIKIQLAVISNIIYIITEEDNFYYNPMTDDFQQMNSLFLRRFNFTLCVLNNQLYAIGGIDLNTRFTTSGVEKYDPQTDTWSRIADMHHPRYSSGAVEMNGFMYAIGGEKCDTIEHYDPKTEKWTVSEEKFMSSADDEVVVNAFVLGVESNIRSENILNYYSEAHTYCFH